MSRHFFSSSASPNSFFRDKPYLERSGLNKRLKSALKNPVLTVTAGEGYGKTHSVYSFLRSVDVVTTWVQFSERDNLGWHFWENYTGAFSLYHRGFGTRLLDLGFPETIRQVDRYATLLEQERVKGRRYVTVGDDFHLIHEKSVLRFIERNLSIPFPNTTIILISRKEPAINSVSLLSKGKLSQITVDDLRFSKQEVGDYFALQDIVLSPGELDQIYDDSEGWALAINMVAEEMKRQGVIRHATRHVKSVKRPQYTRTLMEQSSFKNMEDEILEAVSRELRNFLIKLSLIERWPPELLEKLALNREVIGEMENLSSFIRYDMYLHGYRIHHLFLEFLKEKQGELEPQEIREVYLKAASWYLENNLLVEAAINYERARDYRGLINIIYTFPRILPNAVAAFFLEIVDRLLALDPSELPAGGDEAGSPRGSFEDFAFLRYAVRPRLILGLGRVEESIEENRRSIAQFEALSTPLSSRILATCYNQLGALGIITSRVTRNYDIAPLFEKSNYYYLRHPEVQEGPITQGCVSSYIVSAGHPVEPGELERAVREFSLAAAPASASFNGYRYGTDTLGWAELAFFTADINNAEKFARQAVFQTREKKQYEIENRSLFYLLRINIYTGNFSGVQEVLKQLSAQLENTEFLSRYILHDIETGWFYAQIGQTGKIASWLKNDFEESELNTMLHGFETLVKARCSFAEEHYKRVLKTLSAPQRSSLHGGHGLGEFLFGRLEMRVLEAVTLHKMEEHEKAFAALEDAWDMAAPNNLDMPFIELGENMRALAALAAEKKISIPRSALENIRNKASVYAKKLSIVAEQYWSRQKSYVLPALSFRETEVLNGLAQGLTREEIAEDSGLSVSAVKNVITALYAKLGALNRADAIRIAGSAGLIRVHP
ncbi:MAG: LuxR C-terminal-related transcriptional regulator [Treponema sp.]|jgi:LuxR family maltose regulon positive regulatory protein|nr:LuxR C-terminal-related transcriptional regulator [Treponema sp.]